MKKILLPLLFTVFLSTSLFAQAGKEIKLDTNFFTGMALFQGGEKISVAKASKIMESNPTASSLLKRSNKQAIGANIIGAIGGMLVGWQLGAAMAGDDPNWALASAGGAIIVVSAVVYSSAEKKAKRAVSLYNEGLTATASRTNTLNVRLFAKTAQFGVSISF